MAKKYKIERGIKMPAPARNSGHEMSKATETMRLLKVTESFLVRDALEAVRAAKLMRDANGRELKKADGMKFASRRVKGGLRIWRVK